MDLESKCGQESFFVLLYTSIWTLRYGDYELRLDERCPLFVALR